MNHPDHFINLLASHAAEVDFWRNNIIAALPHMNILQSIYHKWTALPDEVKLKVQDAGYSALLNPDPRTARSQDFLNLKYKRFALMFAHAFDCWNVMQETFGACGSETLEVTWTLAVESDALHAINELEELIHSGIAQQELELSLQALRNKKRNYSAESSTSSPNKSQKILSPRSPKEAINAAVKMATSESQPLLGQQDADSPACNSPSESESKAPVGNRNVTGNLGVNINAVRSADGDGRWMCYIE